MNTFKRQCIELRKLDYTLPEIARITGRPKTSVHFHIRHLPLSARKKETITESYRARILQITAQRRGKSKRTFRKFSQWSTDTVFVVSHFLFDGEIKCGCIYNNRNGKLIARVKRSMDKIYDLEPKYYIDKSTGVSRISYYNVELGIYIKKKAEELLQEIDTLSLNLKREFVRSFFDDEGCMDFRPTENIRRVRGYQKNTAILYLIKELLEHFSIDALIKQPNEIVVVGKENLVKFQKEINFSPGVRINGNRSNSIWKQSLEKRLILRKAIASYKPVGSNGVHRD